MKLWPANQKKLQRLTSFLVIFLVISLVLFAVLFDRYLKINQTPPRATVASQHLDVYAPPCSQRVDKSGWKIVDNRIQTFPRCLTVMNSRFGSRFNFDWYFSNQKTASSVLGTLEDKNNYLRLSLQDETGVEPIFPLMANHAFPTQSVDLGLTYQKTNFKNDDFLLSFNTISPFTPTQNFQDPDNKINSAPFFFLELSLSNKTGRPQNRTVRLSMGGAKETKTSDDHQLVYFQDGVRGDGQRALAAFKNQASLSPFVEKGQGGFDWQVTLEPGSSQKIILVYAGFVDDSIINDKSGDSSQGLKFTYTQWFENIDQVIDFAFAQKETILAKTNLFEKELAKNNLSPQFKWLLAQAFHSYLGNTWLVYDEKDKKDLRFYVWEGEFKYLNTVDVAHDYDVLAGLYFPWVLKLELDSWAKSVKKDDWGQVIPHDLGTRFYFKGSQTYGIPGFETSGMPVEENTNFILLSYWYWHQTKDDQYLKKLSPLISDLTNSLVKRDTNNNGIADQGIGITTYDNDGNLALLKGSDSAYLGLKQLAAYLSAEKIFKMSNDKKSQAITGQQAELITKAFKKAHQDYGFIPLSLDLNFEEERQFDGRTVKGIEEQGFAFITGLFYPTLTQLQSDLINELKPDLAEAYQKAYQKSLVKNEEGKPIGLQLTEYQALGLGWLSHSVMADYIAQNLLGQNYDSFEFYFPLLYDNPGSYSDGQYFVKPFYPLQTTLIFYPRGAALFAFLGK